MLITMLICVPCKISLTPFIGSFVSFIPARFVPVLYYFVFYMSLCLLMKERKKGSRFGRERRWAVWEELR